MAVVWVALLGLACGSFATVCVHRLPQRRSLFFPGSHCPSCQIPLRWFDNLPLVSFLLLRGRCRACHRWIPWRYPLIELLTAGGFVGIWLQSPHYLPTLALGWYLTLNLVIASCIDASHKIIPDIISWPLIGVGLATAAGNPLLGMGILERLATSLLGGAVGAGILTVTALLGARLFRREALGGGDVKLLAGIGTLLGWPGVVGTLLIGSCTGSLLGLTLMALRKMGRGETIPFGPFLSAGAYTSFLFPDWWKVFLLS